MVRSRLAAFCSLAAVATLLGAAAVVLPASAEPATPVRYGGGAATTTYSGLAFDTCIAPPLSTMRAWRRSPYNAIGVYIGGVNRGCPVQPNLTPSWVSATTRMGWRLLPIYVGRQAPCGGRPDHVKISSTRARAQGRQAGQNAAQRAKALGMRPGSGIYLDMENYNPNAPKCRATVLRFISGWVRQLHRRGYLAGVYANQSSGAVHLAQSYDSRTLARPDALWIARWDGSGRLTDWPPVPNAFWARAQRAKQYRGGHHETWGGVRLNIDNDRLATPVATVAKAFPVTSNHPMRARKGPGRAYAVVRTFTPGTTVGVVCQTEGSRVKGSRVWDKLANGAYAPDAFVGTPGGRDFSARIPRCRYAYQVSAPGGASVHARPRSSTRVTGTLPAGSLARVVCQRRGSRVGPTRVWDKLDDGRWVSDRFVANRSRTGFTRPIPRC
jgi:hypothetical protein